MQLRRIVEATGAKIVLSTDWRRQVCGFQVPPFRINS